MSEVENVVKTFNPLYDNVVLEAIQEKTSKTGLEIPKMAQEKVLVRARVLAVGPGKYDVTNSAFIPTQLKVGDVVYINTYIGMKIKPDVRTEYIIQKEDEIRVKEVVQG